MYHLVNTCDGCTGVVHLEDRAELLETLAEYAGDSGDAEEGYITVEQNGKNTFVTPEQLTDMLIEQGTVDIIGGWDFVKLSLD